MITDVDKSNAINHNEIAATSDNAGKKESAEYISEITMELMELAKKNNLGFLAYLLEQAHLESKNIVYPPKLSGN